MPPYNASPEFEGWVYGPTEDPRRILEVVVGDLEAVHQVALTSDALVVAYVDLLMLAMLFRQTEGNVTPEEVYTSLNFVRKVNIDECKELGLDRKLKRAEQNTVIHGNIPTAVAHQIDSNNNVLALLQIVDKMPRK